MRIITQSSAKEGFLWFRRYSDHVFPAGKKNGLEGYRLAMHLLEENPAAGHFHADFDFIRELSIPRTPFTFVYMMDGRRST